MARVGFIQVLQVINIILKIKMKVRKTHILQLVFIHCGFRQITILNWLYIVNIYTIFDFEHRVVAEQTKNFIKKSYFYLYVKYGKIGS